MTHPIYAIPTVRFWDNVNAPGGQEQVKTLRTAEPGEFVPPEQRRYLVDKLEADIVGIKAYKYTFKEPTESGGEREIVSTIVDRFPWSSVQKATNIPEVGIVPAHVSSSTASGGKR